MFHSISSEVFGTCCFFRSGPLKHEGWGSTVIMCWDWAAGEIQTLFTVFADNSDPHCKQRFLTRKLLLSRTFVTVFLGQLAEECSLKDHSFL